jgi:putative PIN family toxin of toxin-antitoxin system
MIVLLDTNVVISALFSPAGSAAQVVSRWEAAEFEVVVSPTLLEDLGRALQYPKVARYLKLSPEEVSKFLRHYAIAAVLISPRLSWM